MSAIEEATVRWDRPGPGAWAIDGAHNLGPVTRIVQDVFPGAMAEGFQSFTGRYGMPISHIDVRYVNGFGYGAVRVAGVPVSDKPPPPAPILRIFTRVHPVMRRRNRAALAALRRRVWRDDLDRWFDELRPARTASLRAMQAIDPADLDPAALAEHLGACVSALRDGLREHFSLVGASGLPVGLHLVREATRGRSVSDALGDLRGAAARSTAATLPALAAVADALRDAGVQPVTIDDVRTASPAAAIALDAYLAEYGQRVVGALDVTGHRLVELPDVIVRTIAASAGRVTSDEPERAVDDPVLEDARLALASRDDHAGISCMWPLGLTRRALLEVGARLHAGGRIDDPSHALDGTLDELVAMLSGDATAPSGAVLAERTAAREAFAAIEPPAVLGTMHAPPDPSLFPAGLRQTATAMGMFIGAMETTPRARDAEGFGIGGRAYRGRAVVAVQPEAAIVRLEQGDVLITPTTTPAFNCVLPLVGALVTTHGGPMSHAGIAARELGIPAVLGVGDALDRIPDGAEVIVDPVAGTVRLAPAHVAFGPGVASPSVAKERIGSKAAGLIAMATLGLPVPAGVVLPAALHRNDGRVDDERERTVRAAVRTAVAELEEISGKRLGDREHPLLVSVRSGSAVSMPGMMDSVLDVGITADVVAGLASTTGDASFAADVHRRLLVGWATVVGGLAEDDVHAMSAVSDAPSDLARRLADVGCTIPDDPLDQVVDATLAVYRSWDSERAREFRRREHLADDLGTAVTIQSMVFGNRGSDSGTGVVFSRDPSTGAPGCTGEIVVGGQGDDVVGGRCLAQPLAEMARLWPVVHRELVGMTELLERHHRDLVDVEFTVEQGRLHLLQCRPGRRSSVAAVRIAVDMAEDPAFPVDRREAVRRCRHLLTAPVRAPEPLPDALVAAQLVVKGLSASPGRGTGVLAVSVDDALARHDAGERVVLARPDTSPADVAAMAVAAGVVTASGGLMSHAAVVARSWNLPAVVGASDLVIEPGGVRVGDVFVAVGETVTVDGTAGIVLRGAHAGDHVDPPELEQLRRWASTLGDAVAVSSGAAPDHTPPPEDVDVLRIVVLRGRAAVADVAAVLGAAPADVTGSIHRLADAEQLDRRGSTVTATDLGRAQLALHTDDVVRRHGSAFVALLDRFRDPDRALKRLVTGHQLAVSATAAATNAVAPPRGVAEQVRHEVHERALVVIADAAAFVPRLQRYAKRLAAALERLDDGDHRYLAHPGVESYHTVWFELHEELIRLAGSDRSEEH